jgi:signal peptidase I
MHPALASGDQVLVRRRRLGQIRRGAVVAVRLPLPLAGPRSRRDLAAAVYAGQDVGPGSARGAGADLMVKRAVALPGDPVPEGVPGPSRTVPAGHLVVLGDNPGRSHDSRAVGYVPAGALLGVVVRRLEH